MKDCTREMAEALAELAAQMAPMHEAVEGYRQQMERAGYGEGLSRKMAADYHAALLRTVFK